MKMKLLMPIAITLIIIVAAVVAGIGLQIKKDQQKQLPLSSPTNHITNFDECAAAGYPVLETYPAQCRTPDGRNFTQDISTNNQPAAPINAN